MPTHEALPRSTTDLDRLTPAQRRRFRQAVNAFVDDLRTGHGSFRAGLRVKGVRSAPSVFEPARAPNGRAMWSYSRARIAGEQHVIWRRIGSHELLVRP
ncbi:hypothetical protein [Streptomyces hydrogenans]|uniref:Uncharacterized protein n=1 Tax=Streptomyces hydrogenans TaxID=1873719 RepID=A0ABQ3PCF7_9ACTN|nr:hypothetical protein [Streptomyces hydrogenans]GHG19527.1 hypothetical protein GCM10018784_35870 [Streptomyces hydrogenans]GHI22683.1 hypothetical protein Shyd_40540 [Streptomyces hydrogenans]GHI24349.1 hypothetical protein Shyd_57200 [Streptomyces hydrogenans]